MSSVGSGGSSVVGMGAGAPMSFESPVGDRGGAAVGVAAREGTSGAGVYVGAVVSSTSVLY